MCALASAADRVLDVGGWWRAFNLATHVLDLMPYATRRTEDALDPENPPRFSEASWTVHDACRTPWPYPDQFFGFSFCSHTLEDLRDPLAVCHELTRVARAGYIETPSREREIFCKSRFFGLRVALGRMPEVGFEHHRWMVEIDGRLLRFRAKDQRILRSRRNILTRADLGRRMTEEESAVGLFWEGGLDADEVFTGGTAELRAFRYRALCRLRSADHGRMRPTW